MAAVLEVVAQFIFEVLAYGIGKIVAAMFLPHLKIEPLRMQKSIAPWKWRGFTYKRGSGRFLYTESVQLIGVVSLLVIGLGIYLMVRFAN
ncbi:multidrug transporter EmrE-like cation transporter [Povalibacter uvarum]|uniref:Multidrug transporter EmrE-like cation transporter n=1 Tax=Povalibacter uvarum TaxID=732238 RepID=A0A841HUF2_9GAMM|nr:hypothetical protein [Povalibacter uvarum]MBB6096443.1 multidrug transporter EmrE-like cation transporter [Povalibacter uvarum]